MTLEKKTLNGTVYWEMAPPDAALDLTLVLTLHYMTGDGTSLPNWVFRDFEKPLRVLSLQGEYPSGDPLGGYSWFPGEETFYDLSEAEQAAIIRQQADRIAAFLKDAKAIYPGRTVVVGKSQGGDLTLALTVYHPELIELSVPVAGRMFPAFRPDSLTTAGQKLPPIFMKAGTYDEIVPIERVRDSVGWLNEAGFSTTLQEYPVGHVLSGGMIEDIRALLVGF
jgi:predicted esterase